MPELPEVETVARQLAPLVRGRRVRVIEILDSRLGPAPAIAGRTVSTVRREGKEVLLELSAASAAGQSIWLAVHLRMSGRLIFASGAGSDTVPHLRARISLDDGFVLLIDPRRFGTFRWLSSPDEAAPSGLDPTRPGFTLERLRELLRASTQPVKLFLLRQDRLSGIGNIYASEILHRARISPLRRARSLSRGETARLYAATTAVLEDAIRHCGTTFSDFQDAHGVTGTHQRFLAVYDREGEPCHRCGGRVVRVVQAQRSTYYCPVCTKRNWGRSASGQKEGRHRPALRTIGSCPL